ncbi:hypothetical protein [Azotobacter chroococcum]|uniref:hypothetical protein n=1 Tax=Azotobacter chroococcum TaxID=353 RepID=UPI0010AE9869|nr:hypothetical protein [Azotobacter chroococcum]TKD40584.1 hypothetical protein FCG41_09630 [Azotobacter chroococcum]
MAKERVYILTEPVQFGTETITQVTITRKLKHLRSCTLRAGADAKGEVSVNLDFGTLIDLGAKMIGHPVTVLEEFAEEDQSVVIQEANDFLFKHLGTGPKP